MGGLKGKPRAYRIAAAGLCALAAAALAGDQDRRNLLGPAKKTAREQLDRMGEGYEAYIDTHRHVVYISALDDKHRRRTVSRISAYIDAQQRTLLKAPVTWNITVVLPTVEDYRKLQENKKILGFYNPAARRVTSIDHGRVLIHEFTHALHHADMARRKQVHPPWVSEGLATLFELSRITPAGLEPMLGPRLASLQRAIRQDKALALKDLTARGSKRFMAEAALAYAQSRYLMYYLRDRDKLKQWYETYCRDFNRDPSGAKALEATLGRKLDRIEKQWRAWVLKQEARGPARQLAQGRVGLEFRDSRRGVQITAIQDDSAADSAKRLRVGDLVEKFNGRKILTAVELAALIRQSANRTATFVVRRRGRTLTIRQPLGAADKQ
jgi:hypothetical protein